MRYDVCDVNVSAAQLVELTRLPLSGMSVPGQKCIKKKKKNSISVKNHSINKIIGKELFEYFRNRINKIYFNYTTYVCQFQN